ncbi:unnamed protein product (macronuclear) [Paramecium tetraurelia]|uniref:Uncharacterized protein n=1 Tax=Paramecium tetraurelia TaxID=5888 RepID=A0BUX1_PARTE|nr:uncharacterized protein GSPATT00005584001 [Paramecium tetraurelia]CAK62338.1 unnamed protein product [Paramecium tetraurelia]|eukprot:XP_001429736.1 hypothetical protein (macronuclear) [Paramecium tetraurelia strain d4-2]
MHCFRAFAIFNFELNQICLILRRDIEQTPLWQQTIKEIQHQIGEQNVMEEKVFSIQSLLGKVRGKYDYFTNRLLILVSHEFVDDIFQAELLLMIYAYLCEVPNYKNLKIKELEAMEKFKIENLIKTKEEQLKLNNSFISKLSSSKPNIQEQLNQKMLTSTTLSSENNDLQSFSSKQLLDEQYMKVFRGFMLYDKNKQYFLMFVRKGFSNDKTWIEERVRIENILLETTQKTSHVFCIQSNFGQFIIEYDAAIKFYFVLLSRHKAAENPQYQLLQRIKSFIQLEPKFHKQKKCDLESKLLYAINDIVDAEERIYASRFGTQIVESRIMRTKCKSDKTSIQPSQKQIPSISAIPNIQDCNSLNQIQIK